MKKILSIIVPIYNGEKYLDRLLKSLVVDDQCEDLEVLLINDGSTDSSEEICKHWVELYPSIFKYIYKENSGVCATRNLGIDNAVGDFFGFADQDDWYENGAISFLIEKAKNTKADMVIYEPQTAFSDNRKIIHRIPTPNDVYSGDKLFKDIVMPMVFGIKDKEGRGFNFGLWNCLFRKKVIDENKLRLDAYLRMGEDITFITQALGCLQTVETIQMPLYNWFVNFGSVSHTYVKASDLSITKTKYIYKKREEALANYPQDIWKPFIDNNYASIIGSIVRNWTNKKSGESYSSVIGYAKKMYDDEELKSHIDSCNPMLAQGKSRIELFFIRHRMLFLLVAYFYLLNYYVQIRDRIKRMSS